MPSSEESRSLATRIVAQSAVQFKIMEIIRDMKVNPPSAESRTNEQREADSPRRQSPISGQRPAE